MQLKKRTTQAITHPRLPQLRRFRKKHLTTSSKAFATRNRMKSYMIYICLWLKTALVEKISVKGGYPIIFASNVFYNSHLIRKCMQNQQQLMILDTFLKQMRVVKNIRLKMIG